MFLVDAATQDQALIHGFIRQVADNLDIGAASTRVAVVSSRDPHVQIRLDDYAEKSLLLNAIDSLAQLATPGDIVSALVAVRQNVLPQNADDRQAQPGIVFIVADDSLDLRDDALIAETATIRASGRQLMLLLYGSSKTDVTKTEDGADLVSVPLEENLFLYASAETLTLVPVINDVVTATCEHIPSKHKIYYHGNREHKYQGAGGVNKTDVLTFKQ